MSDDLILKAGDELTRTELKLIVGTLAALKSLAVDKALEVDDCDVALGGCAILNGDGSALRSLIASMRASTSSGVTAASAFSASRPL